MMGKKVISLLMASEEEKAIERANGNTIGKYIKACAVRVLRTMAETAIAMIGTSTIIEEVNWMYVLSATGLSGIITILACIVSMPEVE